MKFKIESEFEPKGDQPEAIKQLVTGFQEGKDHQVLLGVTGSGKTFTIANLIEQYGKPTLIISHNKTLAAQLYQEFKNFFPNNLVEYFVSYYDYYQPEAYLPVTDTYIEKDLQINDEIERLRLSTVSALLSGRTDVIVISTVSCIYGAGNPDDFHDNIITLSVGDTISRNGLLRKLVTALYSRSDIDFSNGRFRVKGDTIDVHLAHTNLAYRITMWDNEIEELEAFDPSSGEVLEELDNVVIYPAKNFMTNDEKVAKIIDQIKSDLGEKIRYFEEIGKDVEAKRLEEKVNYDIEMMQQIGYCPGIENYSRYFDGREEGSRPFCLIDYFPKDYLQVLDESHVTVPQVRAMFGGDFSRKKALVEYGFRLDSAFDNRPLKFPEFEMLQHKVVYMSATPADYELAKTQGEIVEQIIRPTGLLDPEIEVFPTEFQIDDLIKRITKTIERGERVLVTTLTKKMAEELDDYFDNINIKSRYIHSDVTTLDRVKILTDLRAGEFDVLVGVNLLREGLDLPEVSLVAILDADKEGFLRSERSLIQTVGRAARNVNGKVVMYADKITDSMRLTIDSTNYRRSKQMAYNDAHGIKPTALKKSLDNELTKLYGGTDEKKPTASAVAESVVNYMSDKDLQRAIAKTEADMKQAAKDMDYLLAAQLRDELFELKKKLDK